MKKFIKIDTKIKLEITHRCSLNEHDNLENNKSIDILNYIKNINSFPNTYIAYRIMLTILVSFY